MKKIAYIITCTLLLFSCKVIDEIKKELLVKIQTSEATGIYAEGCVLGGNVTDDGGKAVTEYGVCYSTSPGPTTSNTKVMLGAGSGSFQTNLYNKLIANTSYYCRAYCINAYGTTYGNEISFKTPDYTIPTFIGLPTTTSINEISIGLKGAMNFDGVMPSDWGFCYSETSNPTITNNKVKSTDLNGGGTTGAIFTAKIGSLKSNTTYFIRAYSTNKKGTGYSDQITVKTNADPALTAALAALKSGLQVYYPFNGNASDASGNGFNGTITGVTPGNDRFGNSNSAMYFSGVNGTKILTTYKGITGTASRTISLWAKTSTKFVNHTSLLSYGGDPNNGQKDYGILMSNLGSTNPYIGVMSNNPGGYVGNTFNNIYDGAWHHYTFVYDSNLGGLFSTIKIYIDGTLVSNNVTYGSPSVNTTSNLPLVLGQFTSYDGAGAGDYRSYQGFLDDVGIWNRVLSASEVQLLYTNQL
jgi:hypothetical protein